VNDSERDKLINLTINQMKKKHETLHMLERIDQELEEHGDIERSERYAVDHTFHNERYEHDRDNFNDAHGK
jgi:hypothetical protein